MFISRTPTSGSGPSRHFGAPPNLVAIGAKRTLTTRPPQSPGVTAANFSAKFFEKFFGESWVAFHETGFLGGAPLGPPPGLEVDLIRLTTPAVTHEWSVTNVDAILATLDQLYAVASRTILALPTSGAQKERTRLYYERSELIRAYVLERAQGHCENCALSAPFTIIKNAPYFEPHRIRRLSDGVSLPKIRSELDWLAG
jgi:hypothetical protein